MVSQPAANNYMMYQAPAAYNMADTVGPLAWRNFAEHMVSGMQTSAPPGMPDGSLASYIGMMTEPLGNVTPKGGAFMYSNGATFGQMQMPPQDGSNNVAEWPMVQY